MIETPLTPEAEVPKEHSHPRPATMADRIAQTCVLVLMFAGPAVMCLRGSSANDADMWWHMRVGEWMMQYHAVPHVDLFSAPLAGQPWVAYSWLFELILAKLFLWRGLVGVATYSMGMVLAITFAIYHLIRRLQSDFSLSVLLTFAAMFSIGRMLTPRPWLFTILLFVLELDILMHVRRTGKVRELAWLPVIFALWANVHIQFVNGLFVLGVALAEAIAARWWPNIRTLARPVWLGAALVASVLATLLNPYGWHIYAVAHDLATQAGALDKVTELQAIPFRNLSDFDVLLLALGSAAALAWRRRMAFFECVLLAFAAVLSFRSQRDVWVMAAVSAAILASSLASKRQVAEKLPALYLKVAAACSVLLVLGAFNLAHVDNEKLQRPVDKNFPVQAVEAIRQRGYSGPVYNDFTWGGYLIWNLRMPVSIDGRQNLYGDPRIDRSLATWSGQPDWASDAQLTSAGLVIGPVGAPLIQLLRTDSRFQLAYEDKVAAVFVTRK